MPDSTLPIQAVPASQGSQPQKQEVRPSGSDPLDFHLETVKLRDLKPHLQNYRGHPEDQLAHIIQSIKENGFYRNIIIAQDNTILAGHGVVLAALKMGLESAPVRRLDLRSDDPRALKVLTGDNEVGHLGERDDRMLSEMLKAIKDFDENGLLGTGYDEQMLANLIFVTRPASEVKDFNEAAEWVGMPEYEESGPSPFSSKIVVNFSKLEDRAKFAEKLGITITANTDSIWYPAKEKDDLSSVHFSA
jgi:hypothetical protein